ncbi:NMDA receptor-regulated gene protein 2 C-terminus [Nesidiocoris tenuis]|uniref:NMDA receptor-regulated gene protein 2 C-terminus n=1 Tax=Nesidiocoris tenuis TaxID=355587 RepID=A0ABN7B8V0_9HEMI|nr:NMDA receptor-regulated gene protein 2 C-terminus [Nesidiocoris tenuis]
MEVEEGASNSSLVAQSTAADKDKFLNEEFDKIFNSAPYHYFKPFEEIVDYISVHSITAKLFRNEYHEKLQEKVNASKSKTGLPTPLCKSVEERGKCFEPYFVSLPRTNSHFNQKEMSDLFAVCLASTPGSKLTPTVSQMNTYAASLEKIKIENSDYLQIVKKRWLEDSWTRCGEIEEELVQIISLWWEERIERVKLYPQLYVQASSVSLSPPENGDVELSFVKHLKSLGQAPRYFVNASRNSTIKLFNDLDDPERYLPRKPKIEEDGLEDVDEVFKPVSKDKYAEALALENHAQLVATPSTISRILAQDTVSFVGSWCIPFCVREFEKDDHPQKIVFMDNKLAPRSLSAVEKNSLFAKFVIRNLFKKARLEKDCINKMNSQKGDCPAVKSESEDDDDFPNLLNDLLSRAEGKKITGRMVNYNLWECSPNESLSVLSKHHKKPFKMLIRTSVKGNNLNRDKENKPCVVLPKLEYQPEYGAALCTFKEYVKEWIKVTLCPNSFLHRVRVDPLRGSTIMIEEKSANELANDCQRTHGRRPQSQLSVFQNLVEHLAALPVGRYLLKHDDKDGGFMFIYQEQEAGKRIHLNLDEIYQAVDTTSTATQGAPWVPLDTTLLTPSLKHYRRIPCSFPPTLQSRKKSLPEPKKKEKKKKKKKNKTKPKNAEAKSPKKPSKIGTSPAKPSPDEMLSYDEFMQLIDKSQEVQSGSE